MSKTYPDHYTMKQNRLKVLEDADYCCAKCGQEAMYVHHRDFSNDNHDVENLLPVCARCHMNIHRKRNEEIKLIWDTQLIEFALMHRGLDAKELASLIGHTPSSIGNILRGGSTKNSTMKLIADALDYPLEFFISVKNDEKTIRANLTRKKDTGAFQIMKSAIDSRVEDLNKDVPEQDYQQKQRLLKYWLSKALREYFEVKSYARIADDEAMLAKALELIKIWRPGPGFANSAKDDNETSATSESA